jgi:transposase
MANVLNEEKKQQVLALGRLGWSLRRIQQATRIRRETASAYLKAAGIAVRPPGGWGRHAPKPANEVITDFGAAKLAIPVIPDPLDPNVNPNNENLSTKGKAKATSKPANEVITDSTVVTRPSACELYREAIDLGLRRGRNARAIWQDLVSEYGFASSYQSVQRFVRKRRGTQTPEARVVIVTAPGQEAQVDYGTGPMVRDPQTGKYRRTRLFVMTLGYSRKSVRLLTFRSSSRIWAELHERAFRRLGGATRIVVLDNLREGVLVPDVYDPALNPLYRDVLTHYGAVAMPCRIQDPDRKGKVESGVGHAQKTPLKGLRFETLEEAQAYLDRWEQRWADTRIHGTTKRQVAAMFAEEKPTLLRLPLEPFRYYQYGERIVHLDGCVEVEAAYYGAPPGWIGRVLRVQWDGAVKLVDDLTGERPVSADYPVGTVVISGDGAGDQTVGSPDVNALEGWT